MSGPSEAQQSEPVTKDPALQTWHPVTPRPVSSGDSGQTQMTKPKRTDAEEKRRELIQAGAPLVLPPRLARARNTLERRPGVNSAGVADSAKTERTRDRTAATKPTVALSV